MKENKTDMDLASLIAHIEKHRQLLDISYTEIIVAEQKDIVLLGKTSRAGILMAGLLENYYTRAETIFFRVSQFFENSLTADRRHKDLLEKMTLTIESVRPRFISDEVYTDLLELMRFRHFKRYYFGTSYDWVRLEELLKRVKRTCGPAILFYPLSEKRKIVTDLYPSNSENSQNRYYCLRFNGAIERWITSFPVTLSERTVFAPISSMAN